MDGCNDTKHSPPGPPPVLAPRSSVHASTDQPSHFILIQAIGVFIIALCLVLRPLRRYIRRRIGNPTLSVYRRLILETSPSSTGMDIIQVADEELVQVLDEELVHDWKETSEGSGYHWPPPMTGNTELRKRKAVELSSSDDVDRRLTAALASAPLPPPSFVPYSFPPLPPRSKLVPPAIPAMTKTIGRAAFICECCPVMPKAFETQEQLKEAGY